MILPSRAPMTASPALSRTATLWVVSVTQFLTPFMLSSVGVALPTIGREFSAGAASLGLIEMIYVLATATLLLPVGRFSDIYGRKRLFITGTAVMIFATIALSLASNVEIFILFRFLQGVGAAMVNATSIAILTSIFPPSHRGRAMGVVVCSVYLGLSAGPCLAGLMATYWGWRWIFYAAVPVETTALALTLLKLRGEWADAAGEKFDWRGSLIYIAGLLCFTLGLSHLRDYEGAKWGLCGGVLLLAVFIRHEKRFPSPLLSISRLAQNRTLVLSSIATLLNYATAAGSVFYFSLYLQLIMGFSPKVAGFIIVVQPIVQAISAPFAGRFSDLYSPSRLATFGMGLCATGLFFAAALTQASSLPVVLGILTMLGLGFGIFSAPNTAVVMSSVEAQNYGMASSVLGTMRSMGSVSSMTIVTTLLSFFLGNLPVSVETSGAFMSSMRAAFIVFGVLSVVGAGCSAARSAESPLRRSVDEKR